MLISNNAPKSKCTPFYINGDTYSATNLVKGLITKHNITKTHEGNYEGNLSGFISDLQSGSLMCVQEPDTCNVAVKLRSMVNAKAKSLLNFFATEVLDNIFNYDEIVTTHCWEPERIRPCGINLEWR